MISGRLVRIAAVVGFATTAWACGGSSGSTDTTAFAPLVELSPVDSTNPTLPPATEAPTTTEPAGPPHIEFAFSGDVLIHSQLYKRALNNTGGNGYDFTPMFAVIKPLIESVDYAICHLEVPIAPAGENPSTFPLYGAPSEILDAVAGAGYDRCSTASNHTLDKGVPGIESTIANFERVGITQAGMARTPAEIEPTVLEVNGIKFTHLSYTYGYNGLSTPEGEEWRSALIDPDRIIADATKAREMGAEFVVVSLHWGTQTAVSQSQRSGAEKITSSGVVDLIVGHHAHMIQPIEQINGVWTVFGLGNSLSYHPTDGVPQANTQDGMIVTVNVVRNDAGGFTVEQPVVHPTWVDKSDGMVIRLVKPGLSDPNLSAAVKDQLAVSLRRTTDVVGAYIAPD
ncbi:MAG: CapA family protein [Acidimicrobiia bacterium]|nr:CapA family protein [Actinomycetota bacterium]NDD96676.1 CapA family protein [Actinomycetota bacterium]NDE80150.1 CapA family protein [Actinomycetota bacterium]NDF32305.1 CapA family protein [Acidimicrobiia bacterium]